MIDTSYSRFNDPVSIAPPPSVQPGGNTPPSFDLPTGLAFNASGDAYVADAGNHQIVHVSPDGTVRSTIALDLHDSGQTTEPNDVAVDTQRNLAVDPKGYVYVLDEGVGDVGQVPGRVEKFALDGKPLLQWKAGPFSGEDAADGVAVDSAGNVYVAGYQRVQKFSPAGQLLTTWG